MNESQFSFLDVLNVASFMVSIENLRENLTQSDKQDLLNDLTRKTDQMLSEIHAHLETQDKKIDEILELLRRIQNEDNQMPRGDDR